VIIKIRSDNTEKDNTVDGTTVSVIHTNYTSTPSGTLSHPTVSVISDTVTIRTYVIYFGDEPAIGIQAEKVQSTGLWCLSEVAAFVKAANGQLTGIGQFHVC